MGYEHPGETSPSIELLHKTLGIEYRPTWAGELYYGSEESIRALGIGGESPFPVDSEKIKCVDPRGLPCKISTSSNGRFSASIAYPGRKSPYLGLLEERPDGVKVRRSSRFDEYTGSAEALVTAGIVEEHWLPGPNHMRKRVNYVSADGVQTTEKVARNWSEFVSGTGSKIIIRIRSNVFEVNVRVSEDEEKRRHINTEKLARQMIEDRPYPILPLYAAPRRQIKLVPTLGGQRLQVAPEELRRRDHLRLVHSENWIAT